MRNNFLFSSKGLYVVNNRFDIALYLLRNDIKIDCIKMLCGLNFMAEVYRNCTEQNNIKELNLTFF